MAGGLCHSENFRKISDDYLILRFMENLECLSHPVSPKYCQALVISDSFSSAYEPVIFAPAPRAVFTKCSDRLQAPCSQGHRLTLPYWYLKYF